MTSAARRPALWLMIAVFGLGMIAAVVLRRADGGDGDVVARVNGRAIDSDLFVSLSRALVAEGAVDPRRGRDALLDALIDQELLFQHGEGQGLIEGDPVVRRRVLQLVLEQQDAVVPTPSTSDIEAWYAAHASRYVAPQQVRFEQLYLPLDRAEAEVLAEAVSLRRRIRDASDMERLAAAWPHRLRMHDPMVTLPRPRLESLYGPAFARLVCDSPPGQVSGPYLSSLGAHLVWVYERTDAVALPLGMVRAEVERDWREDRRHAAVASLLGRLREQAEIERFPLPAAGGGP